MPYQDGGATLSQAVRRTTNQNQGDGRRRQTRTALRYTATQAWRSRVDGAEGGPWRSERTRGGSLETSRGRALDPAGEPWRARCWKWGGGGEEAGLRGLRTEGLQRDVPLP